MLQYSVFRPLAAYCATQGATFQAIDLRWGISGPAALDQQTMPLCLDEVRRCREVSPRLNFLALLGERRGWLPLPATIPGAEFADLEAAMTRADRERVETWYALDLNAVPAHRRLVRRTGVHEDPARWEAVERDLHRILSGAARALPEWRRRPYLSSAVEQEVAAGVFDVPDADGAFALLRDTTAVPDTAEARLVGDLKDEIRHRLPADHVLPYGGASLDRMAADVLARFVAVVDEALAADARRTVVAVGSDLHHRMAETASGEGVVGRDALLAHLARFLGGPGGAVAVVGPSGTGKSTVLAEAAARARARPDAVTVLRLLGTTPATTAVEGLLRDLVAGTPVRELATRYGVAVEPD